MLVLSLSGKHGDASPPVSSKRIEAGSRSADLRWKVLAGGLKGFALRRFDGHTGSGGRTTAFFFPGSERGVLRGAFFKFFWGIIVSGQPPNDKHDTRNSGSGGILYEFNFSSLSLGLDLRCEVPLGPLWSLKTKMPRSLCSTQHSGGRGHQNDSFE